MTASALWSNLPYNVGAPGVNFSADCKTVIFAGNYVIGAFSETGVTSGKYAFCLQYNPGGGGAGISLGFADSSSLEQTSEAANCVVVNDNGNVYNIVAGGASVLFNIPNMFYNCVFMVVVDAGAKTCFIGFEYGGTVNFYGMSGTAYTLAQINAGTAVGFSFSGVNSINPYAWLYYGTGDAALISDPASFPFTAPSAYGQLPPTLKATSFTTAAGTATSVGFTSALAVGTLQYQLMGGSWLDCGGTTSGTAGVATINTPSAGQVDLVILRDGANTLSVSPTTSIYTSNTPPFSGPVLVSAGGVLADNTGPGGTSNPAYPFYGLPSNFNATFSNVSTLILGFSLDVVFPAPFVGIEDPYLHVYTDAGVDIYFVFTGSTSGTGTLTNEILYQDSISETIYTLATTNIVGLATLTILPGGTTMELSRTVNGESAAGTINITESTGFGSLYFEGNFDIAYYQGFVFGIEAAGPPPTETLTLTSASTPSGTAGILSVGGLDANAVMGTLYLDVDGAGFDPAASSSFTVGSLGTAFSGTGGSLSIGTHTVQAQNPATGVESNTRTVIVSSTAETLTIDSASTPGGYPGLLSLNGRVKNATLTDLSISHDNGSNFTASSSLSVVGTLYTAQDGSLTAGSYELVVKDESTGVTSSPYALTVNSPPAEVLTIDYASTPGSYPGLLTFGGRDENSTLSTLALSVDSGSFTLVGSLSVTGTNYTAIDGSLTVGSHTLVAKNTSTSVTSSPYTITVNAVPESQAPFNFLVGC